MKRNWLCFLMLWLAGWANASLPVQDYWQKGNKYYQEKNYDSAASYFQQLAAQNPDAPEVYYNLANSHYRLNHIGPAVLYYSRALQLRPNYPEALANLELTQSRIQNRISAPEEIFFVRWWQSLTHPAKANLWSVASLFFFLLTLVLLYFRKVKQSNRIPGAAIGLSVGLCAVGLVLSGFASRKVMVPDKAVVMVNNAMFREGTDGKSRQSMLPEGTIVSLEGMEQGEWMMISLPDGRTGIIERSTLEKI